MNNYETGKKLTVFGFGVVLCYLLGFAYCSTED